MSLIYMVRFLWLFFILSISHALENGETVCAVGYIMDQLCIDLGTLLDNWNVVTLEEPERHCVHCLVDVPGCRNSGYVVLNDNKVNGLHTISYALNDAGTMEMINLARQVGICSTCTGAGDLRAGFRAGIIGTVLNAAVDPPVISVDESAHVVAFCESVPQIPAPPVDSPVASPTFSSIPMK